MTELTAWRRLAVEGVSDVEKVAAVFEVSAPGIVPRGKFKVKVLERSRGGYCGVPNMAVWNKDLGWFDGTVGLDLTIHGALEDAVKRTLQLIEERGATAEEEFEWSDPEEF